jgi:hypothetical protein
LTPQSVLALPLSVVPQRFKMIGLIRRDRNEDVRRDGRQAAHAISLAGRVENLGKQFGSVANTSRELASSAILAVICTNV